MNEFTFAQHKYLKNKQVIYFEIPDYLELAAKNMATGERELWPSSLFSWLKGDSVAREGAYLWSLVYTHAKLKNKLLN